MHLTADLMLSRRLEPRRLVAVLARAAGVDPAHVGIHHTDADQEGRDWDAHVLCTYHELLGDVRMSLSVSVRLDDAAGPAGPAGPATEAGLAARVAEPSGAGVIHTDDRIDPSTWWLSDPSGVVTRVRLYEHDAPEGADVPPTLTVDAVESAVTAYPGARVTPLAEILREAAVETPVTDGVRRALPSQAPAQALSPVQAPSPHWAPSARTWPAECSRAGRSCAPYRPGAPTRTHDRRPTGPDAGVDRR